MRSSDPVQRFVIHVVETIPYASFLTVIAFHLIKKLVREVFVLIAFGINKLFPRALQAKNETLVRWLIKAGVNVRACSYHNTALYLLLEGEEEKKKSSGKNLCFRRFFSRRGAVSTKEIDLQRRVRIAKLLIQHGADVSASFYLDQTPFGWATLQSSRNRALIQLFLDNGADVNRKNLHGRNVAEEYLANAANTVYLPNTRGGIEPAFLKLIQPSGTYTSALHEACIFHRTLEIRNDTILLADGDINAKDTFGHTPLCYAVLSTSTADAAEDKKSTINLLLRLGADINQKIILNFFNEMETSILELAVLLGDRDIVEILLQHAAKLVDLESGDEKKALSDFNLEFIHNLDFDLKQSYLEYVEELREIRMSMQLAEEQTSLSRSIWFKKAFEGLSSSVKF